VVLTNTIGLVIKFLCSDGDRQNPLVLITSDCGIRKDRLCLVKINNKCVSAEVDV